MPTFRLLLLALLLAPSAHAQVPFPAAPRCGDAFLFEPTSSSGTVQFDQVTVNGFPPPTAAFTLEAWVKYHAPAGAATWPSGFHTIMAYGDINQGALPLLAVRFGELEVYNGTSRIRGGAVPMNAWTHVAYTWDGTTSRLYVNGQQTATSTNGPAAGGNNLYIGYSRGNTGWHGLIKDVLVWSTARSASEIGVDALGRVRGDAPGLLAFFPFDDIFTSDGGVDYTLNRRGNAGPHGLLGWTEDYVTGPPVVVPTEAAPVGATRITCGVGTLMGLAVNAEGLLLLTETGTGQSDGQVLALFPGETAEPIVSRPGLHSVMGPEGAPTGTNQLALDAQGHLLVLQGQGTGDLAGHLLVIDRTLGQQSAFVATHDISAFVLAQGFAESNPYDVVVGPGGDYYVADAAANAVIRIVPDTGAMNVFTVFDAVPNPFPIGPPMTDAVPTGIAFDGERFYVATLTGFPFSPGAATLYTVDRSGQVAVYQTGLNPLVDVVLDPRDQMPIVVEFARADAGTFQPATGRVLKLYPHRTDTLATGLTMPTAVAVTATGTAYVSTLVGHLFRYEPAGTVSVEDPAEVPAAFDLAPNYPNPFNPTTQMQVTLQQAAPVRLAAYDLLGRQVALLAQGMQPAGVRTFTWDASGLPSGVYLLRLDTPTGSVVQQAVLLK